MNANQDLSQHHQLVSDLFPKIDPRDAWNKYKLTEEQVSFFNTNGFLAGVKLLDDQQVEQLRVELEEIKDPSHPRHHLF